MIYEPGDPRILAGGKIKIVVIGGGTGLSNLLSGLKNYSKNITAIVTVTDDGASSGILRKEFDILPPGDIRKCISALALDEGRMAKLMEYRFAEGNNSLSGHTIGNILITALTRQTGSFIKAIEEITELFSTAGKVLPATLSKTKLCANYEDGGRATGESKISKAGKKIKKVFMKNRSIGAYSKAVKAIKNADLIIFGPGSLYTSVIPNLLIRGIAKAIKENRSSVNVFICNCSTERGETENYTVEDHIVAICNHIGGKAFDYCVVNNRIIKKSSDASALGNIYNITTKEKAILGVKIISVDVINSRKPLYHDSEKLAKEVISLYNRVRKG